MALNGGSELSVPIEIDRGTPSIGISSPDRPRRRAGEPRPRTAPPLAAAPRLALLEAPAADRLESLRDRRIPGTQAIIDQIVIAPSGVWIVDAKDHRGEVRIEDPVSGDPRLLIKGLDRTDLLDDLDREVAAVRRALARSGPVETPIRGAICLAETDFPRLRPLTIRGHSVLWRSEMEKQWRGDGPVAVNEIAELTRSLGAALPSAYPARARR